MGLFSGKTVTTVGTTVARVIDDASLPSAIKTGVVKNLYNDEDQMMEYVLEEMTGSLAIRCNRALNYGKNTYAYGLPLSNIKTSAAGRDATQASINALEGRTVSLDYYHFGAYNNLHFGWKKLVESYGYDSSTNELTTLTTAKGGKKVYLKDMQVVVTNATLTELANGSMDQWGVAANAGYTPDRTYNLVLNSSATQFAVDAAASADYVRVDYCWQEDQSKQVASAIAPSGFVTVTQKVTKYESLTFLVSGLDPLQEYHQAKYTVNGKAKYFTYRHGAGTTPTIDAVFNTVYATGGSFFPITYFRYNKTNASSDKTANWYKQSVKLCGKLGMDFDTICDSIHQNPDIADVEQAMLMMAVPANTSDPLEQQYLFDFFSGLYDGMASVSGATTLSKTVLGINQKLDNPVQETSIVIQDARFKMALGYKNISRNLVKGTIGNKGSYNSSYGLATVSQSVPKIGGGSSTWSTKEKTHTFRYQVSESMYEEIQVYGLKMTYWVFGSYTTTGDETDEILLIPIDNALTKHYALPERERLYARSLHYVFNSKVVTKLKWYQTGVFRFVMVVVAIVVTIYSYGSTWQAMAAAVAAGTVTIGALMMVIAIAVLKAVAIQFAIKFFVKEAGAKFAFIAAIVAAVAAGYQMYTQNAATLLPTGETLMMTANSTAKAVVAQVGNDMKSLEQEFSSLQDYEQSKNKLLEDAEALLDTGLRVDPVVIFGESSRDFYQRTVHSGNIGTVGIDIVTNYVDIALQLPKLSDSLGEVSYG